MSSPRVERIRLALQSAFSPQFLEVEDQSHLHAGHAGAATGRGHFHVRIVAAAFEGLTPIRRHRAVYAAVGELMQTDIHALSMETRTPSEATSSAG